MKEITYILSPRIGKLGKVIGGTERVFLTDLKILRSNFQVSAFARTESRTHQIEGVRYPAILKKLSRVIWLPKRFRDPVNEISGLFSDLIYYMQIWIRSGKSRAYIGYSSPSIILIPQGKKIIFMHTHESFYFPNLLRRSYQKAYYIFCSKYLMKKYRTKYKFIDESNSCFIYNSVDTKKFYPKKNTRSSKDRKTVELLFAGSWVKAKGLHILLKALNRMPLKLKRKFSLTVAGGPDLWFIEKYEKDHNYIKGLRSLFKKIPHLDLPGKIEHGKINDLLNSHDYLVFPSIWEEPSSLSLIEAVFAHTPVIAFDVGGNKEILSKNNSVIIKKKSAKELTKVLKDILKGKIKFDNPSPTAKNAKMTRKYRDPAFLKLISYILKGVN